jgi:hypothetical protein
MYVATINVPGYLPDMTEEPAYFDTAAEAWAWLESERERDESEASDDGLIVASDCLTELRFLAESAQLHSVFAPQIGEGTIYGDTPGYDGSHDLGLAYCVTAVES